MEPIWCRIGDKPRKLKVTHPGGDKMVPVWSQDGDGYFQPPDPLFRVPKDFTDCLAAFFDLPLPGLGVDSNVRGNLTGIASGFLKRFALYL
jgi:hypothetical protein